jgi:hypothetical protein
MGFYKFLDSEHVDKLLGGSVKFTRLSYYRMLELVSNDRWIGDKDEGVARTHVGDMVVDGSDPRTLAMLNRTGAFYFPPNFGSKATLSGNVLVKSGPNPHIFCFSCGALDDLKDAMCGTKAQGSPYDACVEILNVLGLMKAVGHGLIRNMDGAPFRTAFKKVGGGAVKYSGHDKMLDDQGALLPSCLRKKSIYTRQQEFRLALEPPNDLAPDDLFLEIGSTAGLLVERFRHLPVGKEVAVKPSLRPENEIASELDTLIDDFSDWDARTRKRSLRGAL